jgi:hypothetical protein
MSDSVVGTYSASHQAMRESTGIVIPVYFPPGIDAEFAQRLLTETVQAFRGQVNDSQDICLCVDGASGAAIARRVASEWGTRITVAEVNRGKLSAIRAGMQLLLPEQRLRYLVIVDQDGDHFANELLNFVRTAGDVEELAPTTEIMVLGRRMSRHRPMGFLRGELEELADRVLLDALHYNAAVSGRPLSLQFALTLDEFPDFHSGYKLFTRATAEKIFLAEPRPLGLSDNCYYRHAVESVISTEVILSGAYLVQVNRSTIDEQPVSTFGLMDRCHLTADKIIWPCKRLNVPGPFVLQWLNNHLPRLLLGAFVPQGRDELLEIRRLIASAFDVELKADGDIPRPRFI